MILEKNKKELEILSELSRDEGFLYRDTVYKKIIEADKEKILVFDLDLLSTIWLDHDIKVQPVKVLNDKCKIFYKY